MANLEKMARGPGKFVTYITNHVTGERIYARSFGKKAFFIPDSSDTKKRNKPPHADSSSGKEQVATGADKKDDEQSTQGDRDV